jgi:hypothetical protein
MPSLYSVLDIEPFDPMRLAAATQLGQAIPLRRPVMGLELNGETFATLQILYKDMRKAALVNSSHSEGVANGTANFVITNVKHARAETIQIAQTFSSVYLNVFGEQPRVLNIQGVLLKSKNFPWRTEWLRNYDQNMRASRTVEDAARLYLTVEDTIYEGHMIACEVADQAETPMMSPMQFTMLLTNVIYGNVGGAYTDPANPRVGGTRASRSEYLGNDARSSSTSYDYSMDANGNIVAVSRDRMTEEELWIAAAQVELKNALAAMLLWAQEGGWGANPDVLQDIQNYINGGRASANNLIQWMVDNGTTALNDAENTARTRRHHRHPQETQEANDSLTIEAGLSDIKQYIPSASDLSGTNYTDANLSIGSSDTSLTYDYAPSSDVTGERTVTDLLNAPIPSIF